METIKLVGKAHTNKDGLYYHHESPSCGCWQEAKNLPHFLLWKNVLRQFKALGFDVGEDQNIVKNYKILKPSHKYGICKGLEFKTHIYPTGFEIIFYQNIVFENRNGGQYDFDKFEKMPYVIKLLCKRTINKISDFIEESGISVERPFEAKTPQEAIVQDCQKRSFTKNKLTKIEDMETVMSKYDFEINSFDRDKKEIKCGQVKYFRHYRTGRLCRGIVYHDINNMWWVITGSEPEAYSKISSFELFDPTPEDFKIRRWRRAVLPKRFVEKKALTETLSKKELLSALKKYKGVKR